MSFGKLYGFPDNARSMVLLATAKASGVDIELVETRPPTKDPNYIKLNPLDRVPTFVGKNGFVLTEVIAVALYFASQKDNNSLLGKNKEEYATVVRWMSFSNMEMLVNLGYWFRPLVGKDPYVEANVNKAKANTLRTLDVLEKHFATNKYLVGDSITLADLFVTSQITRGFQYVLDDQWRQSNPNITRWFKHITSQPVWKDVNGSPIMIDQALQHKG